MVDATPRSGGVVGDRAAGSAELVVEGNTGCEREQAYGDADEQVVWCAGAVPFEGEQVFAGPEDGLDPLPDRRQVRPALRFAASRRADDRRAKAGDGVGEVAAGVAFVADDRFAAAECLRQQLERDVTLRPVSGDQGCGAWRAVAGAGEVQTAAPEPARMALRVTVAADRRQLRAATRLQRAAALDRGRVEQEQIVARAGGSARGRRGAATRSAPPASRAACAAQPARAGGETGQQAADAPRAGIGD